MTTIDQSWGTAITLAFEPARETGAEIELEVVGRLPEGLRGTLYRNGPARWDAGGFSASHVFDGDGLVSKFVIDGGSVRYQSRYVRTPKFLAEERGEGRKLRGLYTQSPQRLRNAGRYLADAANTHAVVHAERLLALSDGGRPWEIDLDDLSTLGTCSFDGKLPRLARFSPHPKIDPVTGELFNFGLDFAPRLGLKYPVGLRCFRVDAAGRLSTVATVPLEDVVVVHDFAITEHYLVFALAPITIDPVAAALAMAGLRSLGDAADYRPEKGMKIVLVPRDGERQRVVECDPFVFVHTGNAYEDGADVVLDVVRHADFAFLAQGLKKFRHEPPAANGWPARVRITPTGRVLVEDIETGPAEFPMHDERRTGREHRYTYLAENGPEGGAIAKLDHRTGNLRRHVFADGGYPGEPVFVPKSDASGEDEGWILAVTYRAPEHRNALVVLDAADIARGPLATALLDRHFFPGFHGSFTTRVAGSAR